MKSALIILFFPLLLTGSSRASTLGTSLPALLSQIVPTYTADHSTETQFEFDGQVLYSAETRPNMEKAKEHIEIQLEHLFGPMMYSAVNAAPKTDHTVTDVSIEEIAPNTFKISYHYTGTVVVGKIKKKYYDVILPVNPSTIYESSKSRSGKYPCTDHHYPSEGDFWYFWYPYRPGCKLKKDKDFYVFKAKFERIPNQNSTYPDYPRLVNEFKEIQMDLFYGLDDPEKNDANPDLSKDYNAETFLETRNSFEKMGFSRRLMTLPEMQSIAPVELADAPHVEVYQKYYPEKQIKIVARSFFGPTGISENSETFHFFLKFALEKGSVMIYNGHSGLGAHLDLKRIAKDRGLTLSPKLDQYQIYFFNSCTSYTYYNVQYFQKKKGSLNLDVLANGLETSFDVMHDTDMAVVGAIHEWALNDKWTSYQQLAKKIDSGNLFGIIGDEDNPKQPVP
jgi:hypothetical protein